MSEKIVLGSGKLYVTVAQKTGSTYDIPSNSALETEDNLIGYIQGGATVEYTPEFYEAKDDLGYVYKKYLTNEEAILRSGVMTWNGATLAKLSATARVDETIAGKRTVKIGGIGNFDNAAYVIRFVYEDKVDGDVRVTIVGANESGFEMAFAKDAETVINAEFKAIPNDAEGTLIIYEEDAADIVAPTYRVINEAKCMRFDDVATAYSSDSNIVACAVTTIPRGGSATAGKVVDIIPKAVGTATITVKDAGNNVIAFIVATYDQFPLTYEAKLDNTYGAYAQYIAANAASASSSNGKYQCAIEADSVKPFESCKTARISLEQGETGAEGDSGRITVMDSSNNAIAYIDFSD